MDAHKSFNVINPYQKGQNRGRRTGKVISKKRLKRNDEMNSFDEYLSDSANEQSLNMSKKVVPTKENLQPKAPVCAQMAEISPVIIIQSESQGHISSAHKETQESEICIKALNPFAGIARYGRRTGKDLLAGKSKLLSKGLANFSDFFSDSDASLSVHGTPSGINTPTVQSKDVFVKPKIVHANSVHLPVCAHSESGELMSGDMNRSKRNKSPVKGLVKAKQCAVVVAAPRNRTNKSTNEALKPTVGASESPLRANCLITNDADDGGNGSEDETNKADDRANGADEEANQSDDGGKQYDDGANEVDGEANEADDGGNEADDGANGADDEANQSDDGGKQYDDGANESDDGGNESDDGAIEVDGGANESDDGGNEADDGANEADDEGNESDNEANEVDGEANEPYVVANELNDEANVSDDGDGDKEAVDEPNESEDEGNKSDHQANKSHNKTATVAKISANRANQFSNSTNKSSQGTTESMDSNNSSKRSVRNNGNANISKYQNISASNNQRGEAILEQQNNELSSSKTLNSNTISRKSTDVAISASQSNLKSSVIESLKTKRKDKTVSNSNNLTLFKSSKKSTADLSKDDKQWEEIEQGTGDVQYSGVTKQMAIVNLCNNKEDTDPCLNFGGDVAGSVSKTDQAPPSQFFGIKKRLTFSNALADSTQKLKENKAEDFNSFLNEYFHVDSTDIPTKVLSKSMLKNSNAHVKSQDLDITVESKDDFLIVDEPLVVNIKNNAKKSDVNKKKGQRKSSHKAEDKKSDTITIEEFQSPNKEPEITSKKPNKRKKEIPSTVQTHQSDNLTMEELQSPIKEPEITSKKPNKRKKEIASTVQNQQDDNLTIEELQSPIKEPEITSKKPNKRKKEIASTVQNQQDDNLTIEELQSPIKEPEITSKKPNKRKKDIASTVQNQQDDNLTMEELQSPIKELEITSKKPNKRKKEIASTVQNQQGETDEVFQEISPLKKIKECQPEKSILKETTTGRPQKSSRKPTRRGPKVSKSKRIRKERMAVTRTRQGRRKAKKKTNFHNESADVERVNNISVESEEDVNPGDVLNPQDTSVELNSPREDLSINHDKDDKLQCSPQLQNSYHEDDTESPVASGKMLSNKQPKSRNRKKSQLKDSCIDVGASGRTPKNVPTFHSPSPQEAPVSKKDGKGKKSTGRKKLSLSTSAAEPRKESLPDTPVHLNLLSALPQVTPKSGISFRPSSRFMPIQPNSSSDEEDNALIDSDVYSTPRSHQAFGGTNTPPGNGDRAVLTSCLRGSSTVKHKRKGRRVTISRTVEQQELSPRSTERPRSCSIASESGLVSMSASPVHYAEITTNERIPTTSHSTEIVLPDLSHKIVPPESPPQPGLRRSKRTRVMRLNRARGEGIIYRRDSTGFGLLVAGVQPSIGAAKVKAMEEERRRKQLCRKLRSITVPSKSNRRLSAHRPPSQNVTMCSEYPILDPETETEVLVECMSRKSSVTWYGPDLNPVLDTDSMAVGLLIQQPSFSSGELHLRPFTEKPLGLAVQTLIFYVIFGRISVTINRVTTVAEIGDSFFIPRGNLYSLKNLRRDVAKLYFVDMGDQCDHSQAKEQSSS